MMNNLFIGSKIFTFAVARRRSVERFQDANNSCHIFPLSFPRSRSWQYAYWFHIWYLCLDVIGITFIILQLCVITLRTGHHHHNVCDISHIFTRKIKIDKSYKTYKHITTCCRVFWKNSFVLSWTSSFMLATFPSESTGNLHTQTNTWNSHLTIWPEQRKASSHHYLTEQRTSSATLPTKKKNKITSQQYFKLMVTQRNSSTTQLEHHNYQGNQQITTIPKIKNK